MQRAMTRLYVLYSRDREQALVRALQRLGVLHIEPIPELPRRTLADSRHELEELLLKVKGLEEALTPAFGPQTSPGPYTVLPQAARRTVQTESGRRAPRGWEALAAPQWSGRDPQCEASAWGQAQ